MTTRLISLWPESYPSPCARTFEVVEPEYGGRDSVEARRMEVKARCGRHLCAILARRGVWHRGIRVDCSTPSGMEQEHLRRLGAAKSRDSESACLCTFPLAHDEASVCAARADYRLQEADLRGMLQEAS